MTEKGKDGFIYPDVTDIIQIHDDIISEDEDADSGTINEGNVSFAVNYVSHGHFGNRPGSVHEKALHLLRLLAANHPFVDGNKRTALNTAWTFYLLNDYYFNYGEEIKAILKLFAVMEQMVDQEEAEKYFREIAKPVEEANIQESDEVLVLNQLTHKVMRLSESLRSEVKEDKLDIEEIATLLVDLQSSIEKTRKIAEDSSEEMSDDFENHLDEIEERSNEIGKRLLSAIDEKMEENNTTKN